MLLFLYLFDRKNIVWVCEIFAEVKIFLFFFEIKCNFAKKMAGRSKLEQQCIDYLLDYLESQDEKSDIHGNRHYKDVCADVKVKKRGSKKWTYFEVKSTEAKDRSWGRISSKELIDSLDAGKRRYEYFFVIIHHNKRGEFSFVCPNDNCVNNPYLTLDDVLEYTDKTAYFGIDIKIKYGKKKPKNNIWVVEPDNEKTHYNRKEIKKIKEAIEPLMH